jgi:hypothetical protein
MRQIGIEKLLLAVVVFALLASTPWLFRYCHFRMYGIIRPMRQHRWTGHVEVFDERLKIWRIPRGEDQTGELSRVHICWM